MTAELELSKLIKNLIPGSNRHPFSLASLNSTMEDAEKKSGTPSIYRGKGRQVVRYSLKDRVRMANSS